MLAMPESFNSFSVIVVAIFVEALPFLALGALLSGAIEVLVPADRLLAWVPRGRLRGIAMGIAGGVVVPTCECGVVPVARRLMKRGVPGHVAVAYMLAAPIVNPVVLASTWFAFPGIPQMVVARVVVASLVAGTMGMIAARMGSVLNASADARSNARDQHDHAHHHSAAGPLGKVVSVLRHGAQEFLEMGRFLILGAVAAGAFKTFLPQHVVLTFVDSPALQVVGMMCLAILLSVCSEADAFVAASFQMFSAAAKLAFITIGPMVDLKLIGMYLITFRRGMFWSLMIVPAFLVFVLSMIAGWVL